MAQKITLDITPNLFQPILYFHQGDVGREYEIEIATKDGYSLPSGATAIIEATKPSGFGFTITATVSENVVSFASTAEMTDEWGRFPAQIKISSGNTVIYAANFLMVGEKKTHSDSTIDGSQEEVVPQLTLLVERVENAAAAVLDTTTVATTLPAGSQATYSFDEETSTATFGIPQGEAGAGAAGVVASAYSASKTYAVGDYAIHNSNLYRCTTAITTAESFTASHWTQVVLADDVTDLKSDINSVKTETASPISLAWEHGGIDNATGQTNNEGSLVRSRDVTYYKESDLYKWYNPNAYTAYGILYTYDGSSYTFTSNVALNVAEYTFNPNSDKYVRFDIREGLDNAKTVSVTTFSNIVNDVLQLKSNVNEIEYGTNLTLQRAKSDDNKAWGDVRVSPVTYIGQVITITNNGATYIIVRPKDSNGADVGAYARVEPGATGTLVITAIPDYINIYCDVYPIDVSIQSPSATAYVESKVDDVSEQLDDVAIDYLDGKICYANLSDFDLTQNQYYGNDLTAKTPTDGNTYHIAPIFSVPAGNYAFYGIDTYWSFYVPLGGTQVRISTVESNGKITISQPATFYLTTRENVTGYANANFVSGNEVFSVAPSKGYFSKKIEQLDGFTQIMATVGMFETVGGLGDSYTATSVKNSSGTWEDYPNQSWLATMCSRSGATQYNYGVGGATIKSYASTPMFTNRVLGDTAKDLYFICFGINDNSQSLPVGTIEDINDEDYTQNADTFCGWYGRVIAQLKTHAPSAKIVLIKPWTSVASASAYGIAVANIATHYGIPCIDPYDDVFFYGGYLSPSINGGHPTLMGYNMMGIAMERLFSKCVVEHPSYFKYATVG